jgi:hypothetical protein
MSRKKQLQKLVNLSKIYFEKRLCKENCFSYLFYKVFEIVSLATAISMKMPPKLKEGGIVPLHECGKGELIKLPDGKTIIPHDISKQIAQSGNNINIVSVDNIIIEKRFLKDIK